MTLTSHRRPRPLFHRIVASLALTAAALSFIIPSATQAASADEAGVRAAVTRLLAAYSAKDIAATLALADPEAIFVMGSDLSEVCDTREEVEALLRDDFQLWTGASFGSASTISVRGGGEFASALFDVPFTMQRGPGQAETMTIRFATIWRRHDGEWKLTQSVNSVPTVGQSAREILARLKSRDATKSGKR